MSRLRVLVVEDSVTVRKHLCAVLESDPAIEVVGEAEDGRQAIELCCALRPDVVTMDMMLPVMSGLAATEYIMAYCATPIFVVSSSTNRGEMFKTYEALAAGAVEVMDKPTPEEADGVWEQRFIAMVKLVARVRVVTHVRGRLPRGRGTRGEVPLHTGAKADRRSACQVVAMGASTGGPGALVEVLRALPADFPLPVLVVIHIAEPFGVAFAEWLDGQTVHPVRMACHGQSLPQRGIVLAPPDRHLLLRGGCLLLSDAPPRHSCRPSVDVLFESLALECGAAVAACLLTGMGADGARGLLAIQQAGGTTIAQDEASSVVYGMPREAALLGAAQHVLPLGEIGAMLAALSRPVGTHECDGYHENDPGCG